MFRLSGVDDPLFAASFREGNEHALSVFYHAFHPALSFYASRWVNSRQVAEEIASEGLLKTWKHRTKLETLGAMRAYLYKTVLRDSLLELKRQRRRAELHSLEVTPQTSGDTPFEHLVRCETYRLIHTALKELSPGTRRVLSMHFLEGKTTGEIARELQLSTTTVKTQKSRGLVALREKLGPPTVLAFYLLVKFLLPPL